MPLASVRVGTSSSPAARKCVRHACEPCGAPVKLQLYTRPSSARKSAFHAGADVHSLHPGKSFSAVLFSRINGGGGGGGGGDSVSFAAPGGGGGAYTMSPYAYSLNSIACVT